MKNNISGKSLRHDNGKWAIEPWDARQLVIVDQDGHTRMWPIDQDSIAEIVEYFGKVEESMNE